MLISRMIDDNFFPYFFIFFAIYSFWLLDNKILTIILTAIAIALLFIIELVSLESIAFFGLFTAGCYLYFNKPIHKIGKLVAWIVVFTTGYMMLKHMIPGVHNWRLVDNEEVSHNAYNYSLWMNLDTALVGLIIFICGVEPIKRFKELKDALWSAKYVFASAIVTIVAIALLLGVVEPDTKLPSLWLLWILTNLTIVCVAEEAFHRFFVLNSIQNAVTDKRISAPIALVVSTTIFTLMHNGPLNYLIVVFIAGLFYGYTYQLTKRIETSIILHFLVNLIHFMFFTYPMLRVDYGV